MQSIALCKKHDHVISAWSARTQLLLSCCQTDTGTCVNKEYVDAWKQKALKRKEVVDDHDDDFDSSDDQFMDSTLQSDDGVERCP